jgi:hypothetical protein
MDLQDDARTYERSVGGVIVDDTRAPRMGRPPAGVLGLGIGELLWDLLPTGRRLGGAPFNVVAHLRRLGHAAALFSAVGDDELGRAAMAGHGDSASTTG